MTYQVRNQLNNMGREICGMCHVAGGNIYCSYYDFMYNLCTDVGDCPEGLDDEEGDDEDDFYYAGQFDDEIGNPLITE